MKRNEIKFCYNQNLTSKKTFIEYRKSSFKYRTKLLLLSSVLYFTKFDILSMFQNLVIVVFNDLILGATVPKKNRL
jgi:hypothetical protein